MQLVNVQSVPFYVIHGNYSWQIRKNRKIISTSSFSFFICSFKSWNLDLNWQCPAFDLCDPFGLYSGAGPNGIKAFGCCAQNEEQPPSLLQVSH